MLLLAWDWLNADYNAPFAIGLYIIFILAFLEGVGSLLGFAISGIVDNLVPNINLDLDAPDFETPSITSHVFSWVNSGRVPFFIFFLILLFSFSLSGLFIQQLALAISSPLNAWLAVLLAMVAGVLVTKQASVYIGRALPSDQTSAVSTDSFIHKNAVIVQGDATTARPAQAKVEDAFGDVHYVQVEPYTPGECLPQGTPIVLVSKLGSIFQAVIANNKE